MSRPPSSQTVLPPPGQDSLSESKMDGRIHNSESPCPCSNLKRTFFFRVGLFSALEISFTTLAYIAGRNPIHLSLPSSITLTETKASFTVIFILWHALAIFIIQDVLVHVFSAEWMEQYRISGSLVAGKTDVVSRATTGLIDRLKHFISNKATLAFRLGFICSMLLISLNALGPSAISVTSVTLEYSSKIRVANLTITDPPDFVDSDDLLAMDRADSIVKIELLAGSNYGFQSEANMLIPWPSLDLTTMNGTIKYESDVLTYNFDCSWNPPAKFPDSVSFWTVGNKVWGWDIQGVSRPDFTAANHGLILPMLQFQNSKPSLDSPLSSFLFVGGNATFKPNLGFLIDFGDVPATLADFNADLLSGKNLTDPNLVSVLVCDPQMRLAPATVTLSNGRLRAALHPGPPVVNNILEKAANAIFSQSLLMPTSSSNIFEDTSTINIVARAFFLEDTGQAAVSVPAKILPLDQINQNMDRLLLSSAKAYLSGYQPTPNHVTSPTYEMTDTIATMEMQRSALTGSKPFLITLLVVICTLIILLVFLVVGLKVERFRTFDLENILYTLKKD